MRVENDNLEGVADQALSLLTQMKRNPDVMPPYNEAVMRACIAKMNDCILSFSNGHDLISTYLFQRCCLAYIHARAERIRSYRWRLGGVLPASIKNNLCEAEIEFFNEYCSCLAEFQAGIGENGVNLLLSTHPPKALYVQHSLPRHDCEMLIRQGILEIAS
uniref:DNA replication complex GINS protein PSF1 n=1 Tax=Angiostrongylus cantonensis TaxID=6313 RepID=A0A0K0DCP1_ANGCA